MEEQKVDKKTILAIVIGILGLLVFSIAASFAYFTGEFAGSETSTTIEVTGGTLDVTLNGGPVITVNNVIPDNNPAATKTFTITGDNTTVDMEMGYEIALIIGANTFTSNAITYTMNAVNTSGNGAVALNVTDHQYILNGTGEYILGRGYFDPGSGSVHTYNLNVFFLDTGFPQNENQGKQFRARIIVRSVR